jgi:uncharacterized protein (DUF736 family)
MSNQQRKPNTGVLFPNESTNPKAPANKGSFSVRGEVLDALNRGESVDFAVWNQVSKEGKKYGSVKISVPFKKRQEVDEAF